MYTALNLLIQAQIILKKHAQYDGILSKGPYPPYAPPAKRALSAIRMVCRALLAGYHQLYRDYFMYAPSQWETTSSLIGWAHTKIDPCQYCVFKCSGNTRSQGIIWGDWQQWLGTSLHILDFLEGNFLSLQHFNILQCYATKVHISVSVNDSHGTALSIIFIME